MSMKWRIFFLVLASFAIGVWVYPKLPEQVASHWNSAGEVDGYMSKFWGAFLMPVVNLAIFGLYLLIPRIEIKKKNLEAFRESFDIFFLVLMFFMIYIYAMTVWWNVYGGFDIARWILPGFAGMIWYSGVLISKSRRNWFVGIRTPWTLSSDKVWKDTHDLGARLFKIAAGVSIFAMLVPNQAYIIVIVAILLAAFIPIVYSYFAYKRLEETKQKEL